MKTISVPVPDDLYEVYLKNESKINTALKTVVQNELKVTSADRLEYVKVICRAKAPVCNWHDMELQILKGAL